MNPREVAGWLIVIILALIAGIVLLEFLDQV